MSDSYFTWSDALAIGVPEIDRQHRYLVDSIDEARRTLPEQPSSEQVEQLTRELLAYAIYHFETEEILMQDHGYGDADRHRQQHRDFSARVIALRDELRAGRPVSRAELLDFLGEWLRHHIMHTDRGLGEFLREKDGP